MYFVFNAKILNISQHFVFVYFFFLLLFHEMPNLLLFEILFYFLHSSFDMCERTCNKTQSNQNAFVLTICVHDAQVIYRKSRITSIHFIHLFNTHFHTESNFSRFFVVAVFFSGFRNDWSKIVWRLKLYVCFAMNKCSFFVSILICLRRISTYSRNASLQTTLKISIAKFFYCLFFLKSYSLSQTYIGCNADE